MPFRLLLEEIFFEDAAVVLLLFISLAQHLNLASSTKQGRREAALFSRLVYSQP